MQCSTSGSATSIKDEFTSITANTKTEYALPGATASTSAPTALPSFQSDVKLVIGRSGSLLWIQCSNLHKEITLSGFYLSSLCKKKICGALKI